MIFESQLFDSANIYKYPKLEIKCCKNRIMCGEIGFCVAVWGDYMRKNERKMCCGRKFQIHFNIGA